MSYSIAIRDNFKIYMNRVQQHPVLTSEEELYYAKRWYEEHDLDAAEQLVVANLRFVVKIAYTFKHYRLKFEDLVQEGNLGLMEAVKRFNPFKQVRLVHYAAWWIKSKIQSYVLKMWRLVKIGTTQGQRKLFFKLRQTQQKILKQHIDHEDQVAIIAKSLQVSPREVSEMMSRMDHREYSIDRPITGSETTYDQLLPTSTNIEQEYIERENDQEGYNQIQIGLNTLNPREREIIHNRYYQDQAETYVELGKRLGISKQRVRQLEQGALKKMKKRLIYSEK